MKAKQQNMEKNSSVCVFFNSRPRKILARHLNKSVWVQNFSMAVVCDNLCAFCLFIPS